MGPEAKLYQKLRKNSKGIVWTRLENLSSLGNPDVLGYNTLGTFFTVELKVTRGNKLKFSPHQIEACCSGLGACSLMLSKLGA